MKKENQMNIVEEKMLSGSSEKAKSTPQNQEELIKKLKAENKILRWTLNKVKDAIAEE